MTPLRDSDLGLDPTMNCDTIDYFLFLLVQILPISTQWALVVNIENEVSILSGHIY